MERNTAARVSWAGQELGRRTVTFKTDYSFVFLVVLLRHHISLCRGIFCYGTYRNTLGSSVSEGRKSERRCGALLPGIGINNTSPLRPNIGSVYAFRNLYLRKISPSLWDGSLTSQTTAKVTSAVLFCVSHAGRSNRVIETQRRSTDHSRNSGEVPHSSLWFNA
jgi:hypothetical protein